METLTVTLKDARAITGLGLTMLYSLISEGRLQKVKIGRRTLITVESIEHLIDEASSKGAY